MFISIDVGGTNTRVAGATDLVNPTFSGQSLRRRNAHDFNDDMAFMVEAVRTIADGESIEAVGIGAPGWPNEDKTTVEWSKNLASWIRKPLVSSLSEHLDGCPVFYDDDVSVAALGEAYYGRPHSDFDYVIWGTGIGGSRVVCPRREPIVSRLSWQTYFSDWEDDTGGAELAKKFSKPPEDFTREDWRIVARDFKRNLASYVETRRPKVIVFGGGLAVKHAVMIKEAGQGLKVATDVTKFGDDSGLMGGFGLIRHRLNSSS